MMDASFVEAIHASARKPRDIDVQEMGAEPRVLLPAPDDGWKIEDPRQKLPTPDFIQVPSLLGLVGYVQANKDGLDLSKCLLHVKSHGEVNLWSELKGHFQQRFCYAAARCPGVIGGPAANGFAFGNFMDLETFIVGLQTLFIPTDARAALLKVIGTIKSEHVVTSTDDGVTQTVVAHAGLVVAKPQEAPTVVFLQPYRTFLEIGQPESPLVLRLREGKEGGRPMCALFEAD